MRYILSSTAKKDLKSIWRYTFDTWGAMQADRYYRQLESCFLSIARGEISGRPVPDVDDNLYSVHCQRHYIFFMPREQVVIVRVLHEKMDFTSRLKNQLGDD